VYQVTLLERIEGHPEWICTCKAFEFGRARPCKHITYAMSVPEETDAPKAAPEGPPPAKFQAPAPKSILNPKQPFYPSLPNIPMPSGGIMVDGTAPPPPKDRAHHRQGVVDSWASPPAKPNVIPVGGKVVMGGKPPGEKK